MIILMIPMVFPKCLVPSSTVTNPTLDKSTDVLTMEHMNIAVQLENSTLHYH